jgi:hypothetical protein
MPNNLPLTDDQLRLATTRSLPSDALLDSDTAAARETFLSLGSAAESAATNFDQSALLARLTNTCLECPTVTLKPDASQHDWLPLVLSGALALAALLAIVRIASDSVSTEQQVAVVTSNPAIVESVPAISPPHLTLSWNDPLDDEIALASATLQQYSTRNHTFDGSLLDINDRLEALSKELSTDTL